VVPKKLAKANGGKPARVVPDVSLVGDPNTGMLVGQTQTFPDGTTKYSEYRLGGTSLSSPLMAGVMALADQQAGRHHGFANPALYAQYGTPAYRDTVAPDQPIAVVRNDYVNSVDVTDGIKTTLRTFHHPRASTPPRATTTSPASAARTGRGSSPRYRGGRPPATMADTGPRLGGPWPRGGRCWRWPPLSVRRRSRALVVHRAACGRRGPGRSWRRAARPPRVCGAARYSIIEERRAVAVAAEEAPARWRL
jgi:hypothetical protein